ncbi:MAG: 16S rRNA (cytosine(1402)-N(4))-methyltransferase [Elusimicrobia bacterium RIFCSPHIGHO2_02_FULL_57_9]|nr:MAG: 16S rRNA (cytosine(1402)-N(4))-methyltransferase [Elusimicrobia bacterium RIFCSPHIGHO2_02_FULL_57_9]
MENTGDYRHKPVLLKEAIDLLVTDPEGLYLDATMGLGGHSESILRALSQRGKLLGMDLDPEAVSLTQTRLKDFPGQFKAVCANFRSAAGVLEAEKFFPLTGALFDLGVSSMQLDKPERGFSIMREGPLDMRFSPNSPLTAETIVNRWPEEQLALLIKEFGEEPAAKRIAGAIVARRKKEPFKSTADLAKHIASFIPRAGIHPATRTFMALRIAVNAEFENITRGIESVLGHMRPGGRILVITFHSLEDRLVKKLFSSFVIQGTCRFVGKKDGVMRPSVAEVESNPRARSSKLRVMEKL